MIVEGTCDVDQLVRAIERLGGKVAWPDEVSTVNRVATLDVEVADADAAEKLPAEYFANWLSEEEDHADPGDVADFVAACSRGDRQIARGLAPRIFASDTNLVAFERGLIERRAA